MERHSAKTFSRRRLVLALILLAPVAIAAMGLQIIANRQAQKRVDESAERVRQGVQFALDASLALTQRVLPLAGSPCGGPVTDALAREATYSPYVRSITLVSHGRLYCSSFRGAIDVDASLYLKHGATRAEARLLQGTRLRPEDELLMLFLPSPDDNGSGVLAFVQGRSLLDILSAGEILGAQDIILSAGNLALHTCGVRLLQERNIPPPKPGSLQVQLSLQPAPLTLTVVAGETLVDEERGGYLWLLPASLLLGGLLAFLLNLAWSRREPMQQQLIAGIRNNQFVPFYQPVVDLRTGRCTGVEMLTRWQHPIDGMVMPDIFIPLAERSGAILDLTRKMLDRVADELRSLGVKPGFHVAVNLSAHHFRDPNLFSDLSGFQEKLGENFEVIVEVTERQAVEIDVVAARQLRALRDCGVRFAIDDFGIGYSGLAYLEQFPLDIMKIDRAFVTAGGTDTVNGRILLSIIDLAKRLDLYIIGEGIETNAQRQHLREHGVEFGQGFFFAPPMPLEALRKWATRHGVVTSADHAADPLVNVMGPARPS